MKENKLHKVHFNLVKHIVVQEVKMTPRMKRKRRRKRRRRRSRGIMAQRMALKGGEIRSEIPGWLVPAAPEIITI